jgi:outer membrane immunogenic protein
MAADLGRPFMQPPTMGPAFSWTGLYIGTHTGVAVGSTRTTNVTPFGGFDSGIALNYEVNPVGIVGGGQVGYNWQAGAFVFGAEFDGGYLGARAQQRPAPDDFVETRYGWYGTATARVGLASERLLSYVKGGAVGAQLRHTASDLSPLGAVTPTDFSQSTGAKWGWTIGSGFEYAILPNWSIKSEYLYMDFGKMRTANLDGDFFDHRSHVHSLKIGLNYRWGGGPVTAAY